MNALDVSLHAPARCGDSNMINRLWLKATMVVAFSRTGRNCDVTISRYYDGALAYGCARRRLPIIFYAD